MPLLLVMRVSKRLGRLIQLAAITLIQSTVYFELYVTSTQPIYRMLDELGEYENSFNYITGWPLFALVNFYYLLACCQSPGSPRANWVLPSQNFTTPSEAEQCEKCGSAKPKRCSHCTRCKVCVVKRDHHCDFTNQCVGAGNYKAFFWFTFFIIFGSIHVIGRSFQWFYHYYLQDLPSVNATEPYYVYAHAFCTVCYIAGCIFTGMLTQMNIQNSLNNCTRIDGMKGITPSGVCGGPVLEIVNEFDMGMCKNWVNDMGWNPLIWWFPSRTDDTMDTYEAHRFPCWPDFKREELKTLDLKKLERLAPGKMLLETIAKNRKRRFQTAIAQSKALSEMS